MINQIISLSSGSKGNATYLNINDKHILIDCGLSYKELNKRLLINVGIDLEDIDFVYISHSHNDHIQCLKTLYNKNDKVIVVTSKDAYNGNIEGQNVNKGIKERLNLDIEPDRLFLYDINKDNDYMQQKGADITFDIFYLQHDVPCTGFTFYDNTVVRNGKPVSYCHIADNGGRMDWDAMNENGYLHGHTYYSIESNYDRTLQLLDKKRDTKLKRRCLGSWGHTSNYDCINNLSIMATEDTKAVIFTHRSEDCNNLELSKEVHQDYIDTWGQRRLFKNIVLEYAEQNEAVALVEQFIDTIAL